MEHGSGKVLVEHVCSDRQQIGQVPACWTGTFEVVTGDEDMSGMKGIEGIEGIEGKKVKAEA
jgi:hypothetical protein